MAQLGIEGMQFYAFHGYYEAERKAGGNYTVDVYATISDQAGVNDDLEDTLNYESIYAITKNVMEKSSKLIEHLAQRILSQLKTDFPDIKHFKVKVKKHHPPLSGEVDATTIELEG